MNSYSSPFNFGHRALDDFWNGEPVYVQEKVDGSQFSFGVDEDGSPLARSRKQDLTVFMGNPEAAGMFFPALEMVIRLAESGALPAGWTYRGEYLRKPRHNHLAYGRIPKDHVILFDVDTGDQHYLEPGNTLEREAERIGLECVPLIHTFKHKPNVSELKALLDNVSVLGNVPVEGIVLKNYSVYGPDKKVLMAKLVSEDFKEAQKGSWKEANPSRKDIISQLSEKYCTEARWRKAVQHLEEEGRLALEPRDIGLLIHEIPNDILEDHEGEIKDDLFKAFIKDLKRGWTRGLPEWYKALLLRRQMGDE